EVSNLSALELYGPKRSEFFKFVMDGFLLLTDENYIGSAKLALNENFLTLGLTDAGIAALARTGVAVLTDDLRLYARLSIQDGIDAINFHHIRDEFSG